ncbi:protein kinase domain-containing protein [Paraliomyxa miuraensis]|uniref:protein kinase domain-containing protein n=1 Tax=Paraliomyxa miuraensis TaxID=376150 RepID=UPI002256E30F|nr:tetratricopeptide repeat protein [Paraliomyxa miuraensis]MCX4247019.1 tetratricopeptide repeat protein [Paraliomyxa miuraensis]
MNGERATTTPCPDEAIIAAFARGELSSSQAEELELHLDACEGCALVVAELARIFESGSGREPDQDPRCTDEPLRTEELAATLGADDDTGMRPLGPLLRAGAEVGRYRVLDCVGVGGMGVVYAAYDPKLDRRIALKLLRRAEGDGGSQGRNARLLREAQVLAKLAHPNVVTVHDAGTWEDQVFVAMEFVEGATLKAWLRSSRSWPELREVFVAAGRGLAAAHAIGLVHRDFKPDNVLIGKDGRVRVTDFGLARWGEPAASMTARIQTDESWRDGPPSIELEVSLTRTGALVGTPAYMAPEQYEHRPADAASDQFGFCVALYEAIYGERPFPGRTLAELASNVLEGRRADVPADRTVPRAVREAIRRGLSRRPGDRFPTMETLLAVIDRRPSRRAWPWVAVGGLVLAMGAGGLWAYARDDAPRSAFCRVERGLLEVWSPQRREGLMQAFRETGLAYAEQTITRVVPAIDDYVARWERLRARSCDPEVAAIEGPGGAALRERCLDRHRVALQTVLEGFDHATPQVVARAVGSVAALPDVERCGDPEALVAELPPAPPPELRTAVEAVRDQMWRGEGLVAGGRYAEGLELARRIDAEATALGHRPLQAETRRLLARLLDYSGQAEEANEAFEEAGLLAASSRHRRVLAQVLVEQVYVLGMTLPHVAEAEKVARRAEAELEGVGMGDDARSALLLNRGTVAFRRGDYGAARELCREAMAYRDREREPLRWADAAFNLATIEMLMGHERQAIVQLRSYVEVFEEALGPMHPEVAAGYQNLGSAYLNVGDHAKAQAALEQAERIQRETLGEEHPLRAASLNLLGQALAARGQREQGLEHTRRSVEILAAHDDPVETATNRVDMAQMLVALGRLDEAERELDHALEALRQGVEPEHPYVADAHEALAELAAARGDAAGVREHMDRVRAIRVTMVGGEQGPELDGVAVGRARLLHQAGARDEALSELRTLLDRSTDGPMSESMAAAHVALAEILWERPERRVEARGLAQAAERGLRSQGLGAAADHAKAWLDAHREH